jgi:hypothetical protein
MGEWANGRMGEWANGRMGEWANGRMGEWANGRVGVTGTRAREGEKLGAPKTWLLREANPRRF